MKTSTLKAEFFVGVFVLTGLVILAGLIVFFTKAIRITERSYEVSAVFDGVHPMAPGTPVRHLGIDVGQLKETGFTESGDKVRLALCINYDHRIPVDAKLYVRPTGILGDYYLEFAGGASESGMLPRDGSASVNGERIITIDEIISQIAEFTGKLDKHLDSLGKELTLLSVNVNKVIGDPTFQENVKRIAAEAPEAVKAFGEMTTRIGVAADEAKELVQRIRKLTENVDAKVTRQSDNLDKFVARQSDNIDKLVAKLVTNADKINETLTSLNEILKRMRDGKGSIGALLNKDDLHEKMVETVTRMNEALIGIKEMTDAIRKKWGK